jgi:hypothetical protein
MHLYIYIAARKPLQLKPLGRRRPTFKVEHLQTVDRPVRQHLKNRHLYYIASFEGCGCAFSEAPLSSQSRTRYATQARSALKDVTRYLMSAVERCGAIEIYAVDNSRLGRRPRRRRAVQSRALDPPSFRFQEGELLTLLAGVAS